MNILQKFHQKKNDSVEENADEEDYALTHEEYIRDLEENWLAYAAGTNDPETLNDVFWNLD